MREIFQRTFFRRGKHGIGPAQVESRVSGICCLERDSFPDDETWDRFQLLLNGNTRIPGAGILDPFELTTSHMSGQKLWSGSRWVPHRDGIPQDDPVCNFETREEAEVDAH